MDIPPTQPIVLTIAFKWSDYLVALRELVSSTWVIDPAVNSFLYVGLNNTAAAIEYGTTVSRPLFQTIRLASYGDVGSKIIGFVRDNVSVGNIATVYLSGIVSNPAWSWSNVNQSLYVDGGIW